jgi:thermolysin
MFQPAGSGPLRADYLIGEDVVSPRAIRSLQSPTSTGQPDHYALRFTGAEDNGGVHINCGIVTHAFYLAVEGGTQRYSGRTVEGVGAANREQMEKVFYRAFTQMLPPRATFSVARAATLQAARDLYGSGSAPERAAAQAWSAVGVE